MLIGSSAVIAFVDMRKGHVPSSQRRRILSLSEAPQGNYTATATKVGWGNNTAKTRLSVASIAQPKHTNSGTRRCWTFLFYIGKIPEIVLTWFKLERQFSADDRAPSSQGSPEDQKRRFEKGERREKRRSYTTSILISPNAERPTAVTRQKWVQLK